MKSLCIVDIIKVVKLRQKQQFMIMNQTFAVHSFLTFQTANKQHPKSKCKYMKFKSLGTILKLTV